MWCRMGMLWGLRLSCRKSSQAEACATTESGFRGLVEQAGADRAWHAVQAFAQLRGGAALAGIDIDDYVADLRVRLQILGRDIDFVFGEDRVDRCEHAGLV